MTKSDGDTLPYCSKDERENQHVTSPDASTAALRLACPARTVSSSRKYAGLALVLIVVALILGTAYALDYQSARGLRIEIVSFYRDHKLSGNADFVTRVRIWNTVTSLDNSLSQVTFELIVDDIAFPVVQATGFTLSGGQSLEYTLRFVNPNPQDAQFLSQINRYEITVTVTAQVLSGIYSGSVTASDARTWNWTCKL